MTDSTQTSIWDTLDQLPTRQQRVFTRYLVAVLVDMVVLNLFAQFSSRVFVSSFLVSVFAAILLQILLKVTIVVEHRVASYFNARPGGVNRFLRFFAAWVVLFGSKFVILEAINLAFGDDVRFDDMLDGLITLIVVVVVMLLAEAAVVWFHRWLGTRTASGP